MYASQLTMLLIEAKSNKQKLQEDFATLNNDSSISDPCDLADRNQSQAHFSRELNQVNILITQLELALQRSETGEYGFCTECGIDIPPERLMFNITIDKCVDCQTALEQKQKHVTF